MTPTIVGIVVFTCTFVGALLGMWLRTVLPQHHLTESANTIKVGVGLIATMTALVLGLITASAKSSFDAVDTAMKQTAAELLSLDRLLARYGSETREIRRALQQALGARIEMIWPQDSSMRANLDPIASGAASEAEKLGDAIRSLKPRDESQRALQSRSLELTESLLQNRWLVLAGIHKSVPVPFLIILLFWLTIIFTNFGLFATRNATVLAVLFVCAASVGSAVFLVLELDGPFDGWLKISAEPFRYAHAHLNQ